MGRRQPRDRSLSFRAFDSGMALGKTDAAEGRAVILPGGHAQAEPLIVVNVGGALGQMHYLPSPEIKA